MEIKELDKWFSDSREIGEIDDFIRQRPDFSWDKLTHQAKLDFYNQAMGTKHVIQRKIKTKYPSIKRKVTTHREETVEGDIIEEKSTYTIVGDNSAEILEATLEHGTLAPLPHVQEFKHDCEEIEDRIFYISDFFSRTGLNEKEKKNERAEFKKILLAHLERHYLDTGRPLAIKYLGVYAGE